MSQISGKYCVSGVWHIFSTKLSLPDTFLQETESRARVRRPQKHSAGFLLPSLGGQKVALRCSNKALYNSVWSPSVVVYRAQRVQCLALYCIRLPNTVCKHRFICI